MYGISRRILFQMDPERAHNFSINSLKRLSVGAARTLLNPGVGSKPVTAMGIQFPHPVGLAAGLDKNGECIRAWEGMGFGFAEVGTVTPFAQPGNDKPRIFRLPEQQAIINRMGFNNKGVDHLIRQVERTRGHMPVGINIGKNKLTPLEDALDDYVACLREVYPLADYVTINISSPNTPGLRKLQVGVDLRRLLKGLKEEQARLAQSFGKLVPMALKIAPDMGTEELLDICGAVQEYQFDAIIATNTTSSRVGVEKLQHGREEGGLSGPPLTDRTTEIIRKIRAAVGPDLTIIGVGGISSAADAKAKIDAGANLVQIYTSFIYQGPQLIKDIVAALD